MLNIRFLLPSLVLVVVIGKSTSISAAPHLTKTTKNTLSTKTSNESKTSKESKSSAKTSKSQRTPKSIKTSKSSGDWLEWKSQGMLPHWLFEKEATYKGAAKLKPMAIVKKFEIEEKFEDCTSQIIKIWGRFTDFQGWMALQGTQCLISQLKVSPPQNKNLYSQWWNHLLKQNSFMGIGPWNAEGAKVFNEFAIGIWKNTQFSKDFRTEVAEIWRRWVDNLNKNDRQDLYKLVAENLEEEGESDWSKALLEREGLNLLSSTPLNGSKKIAEKSTDKSTDKDKVSEKSSEFVAKNAEEDEAYQEFQDAIKQNQLTGAAEKAVRYLDKFPNGTKASTVQDKLFQTYFTFWDLSQSADQKYSEYKSQVERCLESSKLLHSSRLTEFAKQAHRRSDFKGAYLLAKQALLMAEKSVDGAQLLFTAGRSAYFMGLYRESIEFFDRMIQRHAGYIDIAEAKFRRALALIRLNEDYKAEEALAELWQEPENKTYGLSTLYWLIRIKQKRKADVSDLLKIMQDRFFLTYYGLKLSAEANNQKLSLPNESGPVSIRQNWVWTPKEKVFWQRAQDLAKAGWYTAAQGELNNMSFNSNPEQKFLWIQQLVQAFAFPQALRLYNELTDLDPRWRKAIYLKTIFPKPLEHVVIREAQKNELNPILVFSLVRQESAFGLTATSRSQAKGLMQLIPATANEVAQEMRIKNFDSDQMYHPVTNLKFGTYYLAKVIRQFGGNVSVGLAAYNAGPQRVKKFFEARPEVENYLILSQEDPWSDLWLEELPWLETNFYVKSILRNRILYQLLDVASFDLPNPVWKDLFLGTKKF